MNNLFEKYNIKTSKDLMQYFKANMKYGFTYRNKIFTDLQPNFQENMDKYYKIRLGEDLIKSGYGVCWDFCELEREFFASKNIPHECYFVESYIDANTGGPTHTFTLFMQGNKWYWFEYAWAYYCGIWEYNSKEEALQDILIKFERFFDKKLINIKIYKTIKVTKRLDAYKFVEHCLSGQKTNFNK